MKMRLNSHGIVVVLIRKNGLWGRPINDTNVFGVHT